MKELARTHGESAANGRVILAHLGSGASLAAVRGGKPVDTTMSFTPASGIPMSTRSGDLDPGLVWYLSKHEGMDAAQFNDMVNHRAGMLGVSDASDDMYYLLEHMATDERCMDAVTLFCYEVKKRIGALAAAMGGVDALVFAGGIGEKAPRIRKRVCEGLEFLGIELDHARDENNESVLSPDGAKVLITAVYTDEESIIAEAARRIAAPHT
jgi:acetate kinase